MTIKYFALFLTSLLIDSAFGQLLNTKPTAVTDTCYGKVINVLSNDTDDNGDSLSVTKFNGQLITNTGRSVEKKDTGTFVLTSTGNLSCFFADNFYGYVYLTYYVNDFKGSSARRQNGTIVVIREKITAPGGSFISNFSITFTPSPNCIDVPGGQYMANIEFNCGAKYTGWVYSIPQDYIVYDGKGNPIRTNERQFETCYITYYTGIVYPDGQREMALQEIAPWTYNYIVKNSCRR